MMSNDSLSVRTASCFQSAIFRRLRLCQAPSLTLAHETFGTASLLEFVFAVAQPVTVLVTVVHNGFDWGVTAWSFRLMGYLAGVCFCVFVSRSFQPGTDNRGDAKGVLDLILVNNHVRSSNA